LKADIYRRKSLLTMLSDVNHSTGAAIGI